jgi:hypothetical protein
MANVTSRDGSSTGTFPFNVFCAELCCWVLYYTEVGASHHILACICFFVQE